MAIVGDMLAPQLVDHYLARTTFEGQCRPEKIEPGRKDNLFQPVRGRHAVRGSFSHEAKDGALRLTGSTVRFMTAAGALGLAAIAGFAASAMRRNDRR
jgi:hypothetical protein